MPHGDVVPLTPQSEAGRDLVDDTSFEDMMSPNKIAKHGDGPGNVNLLGQIEHLDIEPDVVLQEQDFDVMQHELNLDEDPYEPVSELSNRMKELSYPYRPQEPQLEPDELQRLDSILVGCWFFVVVFCLLGLLFGFCGLFCVFGLLAGIAYWTAYRSITSTFVAIDN